MTKAWQEALSSYASWLWKHPWVAYESKFYLHLWSIQPQRQGTDTELTYPNTNTPFSRNYQITWRHPRTLENSGWGSAYASSPGWAVKNKSSDGVAVQKMHTVFPHQLASLQALQHQALLGHVQETDTSKGLCFQDLLTAENEHLASSKTVPRLAKEESICHFQCNLHSCPHYH